MTGMESKKIAVERNSATVLGIECGSTRIKAAAIDAAHRPVSSGAYVWKSSFTDGIWTYPLEEVWKGIKQALSQIEDREKIAAIGISGMMHGYLAFDRNWKLLVPFRTWQNTITAEAAGILTKEFQFNIPQRWSIAHLYQAILNGEEHVTEIAHITTLAGYVHYQLTGKNVLGVGEASGMFPINEEGNDYDREMLNQMDGLLQKYRLPWNIRQILPEVLTAGQEAGSLTARGAEKLDGLLTPGIPFAPPEGDAGTGMTAANAVAPRTGNVSAGTSIFSMIVLEKKLSRVYEEIDMVTTPSGRPVAMVHCNNCTNDTNAWASVFRETASLFGADPSDSTLYTKLYEKSLEGDPDCGGILVCNYLAGEGITHMDAGRPMVIRRPESSFTLGNFFRAQLYSTMVTLKMGMDILAQEHVSIDTLVGHGGLFKTPGVGQKYMAAVCNAPVCCMETAGEGGPYGMALLAAYMLNREEGESLESYLDARVFSKAKVITEQPDAEVVKGFNTYLERFQSLLEVERTALQVI